MWARTCPMLFGTATDPDATAAEGRMLDEAVP